jgi:hypothetical protein
MRVSTVNVLNSIAVAPAAMFRLFHWLMRFATCLLAADSAAERRLTAAKAARLSVTPRIVEAIGRIARENAILLSN